MLILISPSKALDFTHQAPCQASTQAEFLSEAQQIIDICKKLTPAEIASLMKISDKLAALNSARFIQWQLPFSLDNAKQAIFAFTGDVYSGLQVEDFTQPDVAFVQQHLRILSGLYGILRPLDLIQPYRLEMGTKFTPLGKKNLYDFWTTKITHHINTLLAQQNNPLLVNLASDEYFNAVAIHNIQAPIIKPIFLDQKNNDYKIISFYAKKARGLMSRFIVKNRICEQEHLKNFNLDGYRYDKQQSTPTKFIFKRDHN